jgi:ribonuclease R
MKDRLGEEFTGVISGVTPFGIFVQLDELFVEGLVHVTGLGQDYYEYDEARHELRGKNSGKVYALTGQVTVQVARVDLEARKIDLVLAQPAGMPAPLERARNAALESTDSKPPRRRKAKDAARGGAPVAAVPASAQQVHGMKGDLPIPPNVSASDESDADIVFVPPTRRNRKSGNGNANANGSGSGNARPAAKKAAPQQSAPRKSAAKAPKAASKTSKKK